MQLILFFKKEREEDEKRNNNQNLIIRLKAAMSPELCLKYYSIKELDSNTVKELEFELYNYKDKYLKLKLTVLNNLNEQITTLIKTKKKLLEARTLRFSYNDDIFISLEAQEIFFKTLTYFGAINIDNTIKKRKFKPICESIFKKDRPFFKKIFKPIMLKTFIEFLEFEFNIDMPDKSRISSSYVHDNNVKNYISSLLNITSIDNSI